MPVDTISMLMGDSVMINKPCMLLQCITLYCNLNFMPKFECENPHGSLAIHECFISSHWTFIVNSSQLKIMIKFLKVRSFVCMLALILVYIHLHTNYQVEE